LVQTSLVHVSALNYCEWHLCQECFSSVQSIDRNGRRRHLVDENMVANYTKVSMIAQKVPQSNQYRTDR
jgi:hypothetical protein